MNVLILTVSAGSGHTKAAEAIMEEVLERYGADSCMVVDTFYYVSPILHTLVIGGYLGSLRANPQIFAKLYEMADEDDSNLTDISSGFNSLFSRKIKKLIKTFKPSVIVCTHYFPAQMLSAMKAKNKLDIPLVTAITDYAVHSMWVRDYCDAYIVANKYLLEKLAQKGIDKADIYPYGIPVRKQFSKIKDKSVLRKNLKLNEKPTFLIIGGGLGFGDLRDVVTSLIPFHEFIQIIIVCGKNERLKKEIGKLTKPIEKSIVVYGYVDNIAELMNVSDFILTKPGGLTVSEAMCMHVPIILFSPLPGQEELNELYLINNGVACKLPPKDEIDSFIFQITENSLRQKQMAEMCAHLASPHSTKNIVDLCEKLANKNL